MCGCRVCALGQLSTICAVFATGTVRHGGQGLRARRAPSARHSHLYQRAPQRATGAKHTHLAVADNVGKQVAGEQEPLLQLRELADVQEACAAVVPLAAVRQQFRRRRHFVLIVRFVVRRFPGDKAK